MGCCVAATSPGTPDETGVAMKQPGPFLIKRDKKYHYDVIFPSKPLDITMTSSKSAIDGYITGVHKMCPVENAKETIKINSKVIYVNGILVEGCKVTEIAEHLKNAKLPLRLSLVYPAGLCEREVPDLKIKTLIQIESPK